MNSLEGHVKSLHHVSVGVEGAQEDIDFMRRQLGFRFIKATVLFDGTLPVYHLYYADRVGSAGTVFTTFPWKQWGLTGRKGSGQIKRTAFSAPVASIDRWYKRLVDAGVTVFDMEERLGAPFFAFQNPAGLDMEIIGAEDTREPWLSDGVDDPDMAIRGLHSVVLSVQDADTMIGFLETFGFRVTGQERRYTRLVSWCTSRPSHRGPGGMPAVCTTTSRCGWTPRQSRRRSRNNSSARATSTFPR